MRKSIACLALAVSVPGAVSAQTVNYQTQLSAGEVVLNVSGSGNYTQRGNIVFLTGQMTADAASNADADAINQQNFDLLLNSLGAIGIGSAQVRKTMLSPTTQPVGGQARSIWQIQVELYDRNSIGEVISSMEGAEIRSIQPPQYDISDRIALMTFARQRAIEDAKRKADAYATSLALEVRRMARIQEMSTNFVTDATSLTGEGDVVATANINVDFVLGPMFSFAPAPGTP